MISRKKISRALPTYGFYGLRHMTTHELTIIDCMVDIATTHDFTIISSHLEIPQRLAFGCSGFCFSFLRFFGHLLVANSPAF